MSKDKRKFASAPIRRRLRAAMFMRQGGRCAYCDGTMTLDKSMWNAPTYATFDHVVPIADGGHRSSVRNMVLACRACNEWKDSLSAEDFRRIVNR